MQDTSEKKAKSRNPKLGEMRFGDVLVVASLRADRDPTPADRRRATQALRELADDIERIDAATGE